MIDWLKTICNYLHGLIFEQISIYVETWKHVHYKKIVFRLHEWVLLYTYRKFIETVQNYGLFRCRHRYINFITRRQDTSRTEARIQFHYLVDRRAKRWRANCTWMPSKLYLDDVKIVPGWCQNCTWMMSKLYLDDVKIVPGWCLRFYNYMCLLSQMYLDDVTNEHD
jgi:hypothetical protein